MRRTNSNKILSLLLAAMLIAVMAFCFAGCNGGNDALQSSSVAQSSEVISKASDEAAEIGEGEKSFTFICTDSNGGQKKYIVKTDAATVGEALQENGLIEGEEGAYGLYVKAVCGITADFDKDGVYWAFYVNGEYGMQGVEKTDIAEGATYEFKIEK